MNDVIFTDAIWKLFDILSKIQPSNVREAGNMTFEFSAHSPSDGHHMFKIDSLLRDNYLYLANKSTQFEFIMKWLVDRHQLDDGFQGFKDGRTLSQTHRSPRDVVRQGRCLIRPLSFNSGV